MAKIRLKPQGVVGFLADMLMLPIMYLLQGTIFESPQRTHRWNNQKILTKDDLESIKMFPKVKVSGDPQAKKRWLGPLPLFHMPLLGGWKKFIVLQPVSHNGQWFIGWCPTDDSAGISQIPLCGPVRVTVGIGTASFFGIDELGREIVIHCTGKGIIGQSGEFSKVPLR